ncbi:hypothetical protein F2P45_30175 [Massilia sp. CCM 8733]|uniref:Uncharacterized protein n=1 Tax=Massilia mucilaginosa TaxID=2609282 RepID=A0ABX0P1T4_9BURK|nr:hypothetical protein [Massilia mucilaginosa]NHZ93246.1 hypothetical protein [Massilia mucilaginosa]
MSDSEVKVMLSEINSGAGANVLNAHRAAVTIAQYMQLCEGLRGIIPDGEVSLVAARLTAGIVANPSFALSTQ